MQSAGRGQGGIAELFGSGDGEDYVAGRKLVGDGEEMDGNAGWHAGQRSGGLQLREAPYPAADGRCLRVHI